jgi:hypothetical protein
MVYELTFNSEVAFAVILDEVLEKPKLDDTRVSPTPPLVSKVNVPLLSMYGVNRRGAAESLGKSSMISGRLSTEKVRSPANTFVENAANNNSTRKTFLNLVITSSFLMGKSIYSLTLSYEHFQHGQTPANGWLDPHCPSRENAMEVFRNASDPSI